VDITELPPPAIERRQEYRPRFPYAPSRAMVLAGLRGERKARRAGSAETPTAAADHPPPTIHAGRRAPESVGARMKKA
jgi:hypothetical protein